MPMETDSTETEPGSSDLPGPGVGDPGSSGLPGPGVAEPGSSDLAPGDRDKAPGPQMETIEETRRDLTPLEVQEYCRKVFTFKEVEVARFKSWKERRKFQRQEGKRRMELVGFLYRKYPIPIVILCTLLFLYDGSWVAGDI